MFTTIASIFVIALIFLALYRVFSNKKNNSDYIFHEPNVEPEITPQVETQENAESFILEPTTESFSPAPIEDLSTPTEPLGEKWVSEEPIKVKKESKKPKMKSTLDDSKKKGNKGKGAKGKAAQKGKEKSTGKRGRKPGKDKLLLS
jgi:hypothetical protein